MFLLNFGLVNIITIIGIYYFSWYLPISKVENAGLLKLIAGSYIILMVLGIISYVIANAHYKKKNKKNLSFWDFINNKHVDKNDSPNNFHKLILKGFVMGTVFGVMDNGGVWFGMDSLDPLLPDGILTKAALGNTYSNTLSAFISTFAGNIIEHMFDLKGETPIWADATGVLIGSLFGLYFCKFITGKN